MYFNVVVQVDIKALDFFSPFLKRDSGDFTNEIQFLNHWEKQVHFVAVEKCAKSAKLNLTTSQGEHHVVLKTFVGGFSFQMFKFH